ncbi:hypothetical protein [Legionella feeleii]|uniref:Uncharacterized protein n=1 Tax=Legionella feeleii TaxID=453 RepID=A0A378ISC5_9GAMM|nr:hypothetical protein [Legionella feeleii]STX37485.1 Uncharacterised protein [Legionella feeleii]
MEKLMRYPLIVLSFFYSETSLAINEIWLQDTQCVVVFSNEQEIKVNSGSLISSICSRIENNIVCSDTAKDSTMAGGKPSKVSTYKLLGEKDGIVLWESIDSYAQVILNINHKKYTYFLTSIVPEGILTKHCIGDILQY